MFNKILIANRGNCSPDHTCLQESGIRSVAVYSKEDAKSLHVQLADSVSVSEKVLPETAT